jgi:deoxyribodipyrimidine photo-lyase
MKENRISLFIFRRDYRLDDNTALISALRESEAVIPCFIFDPRQTDRKENHYFSENAFGFLVESLIELDQEIRQKGSRLYIFSGTPEEIIGNLGEPLDAVYINKDYTPFSKRRDSSIEKLCIKNNIKFKSFSDTLLNNPEDTLIRDGKPYTVFTPYWKNASRINVKRPEKNYFNHYYSGKLKSSKNIIKFPEYEKNIHRINGGRSHALDLLKDIHKLKNYDFIRDYPFIRGTSRLSAHLKFGTISIREAYWRIADELSLEHSILKQFYWRDFFYHIAYHFPRVFGHPYQEKYKNVKWENNQGLLAAWKNGLTGFPIIDAGMRELNTTGYMHNRVRMIVASFLTKDLHIDWRIGEKYFAQRLVDYDPCLNNGNWQWAASTGSDSQPYFRIFNPWLQQKKYDPKCEYIKKWVPEIEDLPIEQIHEIFKHKLNDYPKPVVDHKVESKKAITRYKTV